MTLENKRNIKENGVNDITLVIIEWKQVCIFFFVSNSN